MPLIEHQTAYSLDTSKFTRDLGTSADRKAFIEAAKRFHGIDRASNDVLYPARFPQVKLDLQKWGVHPDGFESAAIFDRVEEGARRRFSERLRFENRQWFEEATAPRVRVLTLKLADKLDDMAEKLEKREQAEAASYGLPFSPSMNLLSIFQTARETRERADRIVVWNGEAPERLLAGWFPEAVLDLKS
jgi:hypothetical protein